MALYDDDGRRNLLLGGIGAVIIPENTVKQITFDDARFTRIEQRLGNGIVNVIHAAATMTAQIADAMEARWVMFDKQAEAKAGYRKIETDYEIGAHKMRVAVPRMDKVLELTCEKASHFVVMRSGDGKKKPRKLMVCFKVFYTGNAFALQEWIQQIGGTKGTIGLSSLETESLFDKPAALAEKRGRKKGDAPADETKPDAGETEAPATEADKSDDDTMPMPSEEPIPADPNAAEWRTAEEVEAGVPHHIEQKVNGAAGPTLASVISMRRIGRN